MRCCTFLRVSNSSHVPQIWQSRVCGNSKVKHQDIGNPQMNAYPRTIFAMIYSAEGNHESQIEAFKILSFPLRSFIHGTTLANTDCGHRVVSRLETEKGCMPVSWMRLVLVQDIASSGPLPTVSSALCSRDESLFINCCWQMQSQKSKRHKLNSVRFSVIFRH